MLHVIDTSLFLRPSKRPGVGTKFLKLRTLSRCTRPHQTEIASKKAQVRVYSYFTTLPSPAYLGSCKITDAHKQIFGERLLYGIRREKSERDEQIARNITGGRGKRWRLATIHIRNIFERHFPLFGVTQKSVPKKVSQGGMKKSLRIHHPVATKSTQTKKGAGRGEFVVGVGGG